MHRRPPYRRRAFALVELLIVISIIGMLMSLLLPAVTSARERARQTQCANNLKNLALAVQNHVSAKSTFPGYTQIVNDGTTGGQVEFASWAAVLLDRLDNSDIWDVIREPGVVAVGAVPRVDVFECPSDVGTNPDLGWLTYVANTGALDDNSNSSSNPSDYKENGVFHNRAWGAANKPQKNGPQLRDSHIKDGMSKTLLLSENLDKGDRTPHLMRHGWLAGQEQHLGMVWVYDSGSQAPKFAPDETIQEGINRDLTERRDNPDPTKAKYARPASNHPSGVNVAFCDGTVNFLSEEIDYSVYQRLLTPYGKKCRDPNNLSATLPDVFYNRPPLADSDILR